MFNFVVVGAGFAGSVIAERIATQLKEEVLIIERRNHVGGNCYDYNDENGIIVHRYGPHIFHTDEKKILDYLANFTTWNIYHHKVLALIDGKKVPIPFNFNSMDMLFPMSLSQKLQQKLLKKFSYGSKIPILELKKIRDNDIQFLANFIYEKVFLNYTAKQWGKRPEEINPEVTSRVPVFIGRDDRYFNDRYQYIPKGGYTKIFQNMLNHPKIKIMLNTDFKEIMRVDDKNKKIFFLNNEFQGKIVYTGMLDELFNYKYGVLPYRSLRFVFEQIEKDYFQETASVNYPNDYDFTRITEFKHIHPAKVSKTTIAYEYPKDYKRGEEPYYPMFTDEGQKKYKKYNELASKYKNLIIVGRLADYKYYDMDDVIKRALEVFEGKIKG
ncbi:MAG: UDP-galactopyranose mutase [Elusimicrobiales bacterium]|nr:UDP-galactopyranose mutase [Elusimicrobiales bacterium]